MASSPLLLHEPRGPAASSTPAIWSCQRRHRNSRATASGWFSGSDRKFILNDTNVLRPSQAPPTKGQSPPPKGQPPPPKGQSCGSALPDASSPAPPGEALPPAPLETHTPSCARPQHRCAPSRPARAPQECLGSSPLLAAPSSVALDSPADLCASPFPSMQWT